jgi:hypothetical protein
MIDNDYERSKKESDEKAFRKEVLNLLIFISGGVFFAILILLKIANKVGVDFWWN